MDEHEDAYRTICRICLTSSDRRTVSLLNAKSDSKLSCYGQSILAVAKVSINPRDKLPAQMCYNCVYLLKQAIRFKLKCEMSHRELTELISCSSDSDYKRNVIEYALYQEYLSDTSEIDDDIGNGQQVMESKEANKDVDAGGNTANVDSDMNGSNLNSFCTSGEEFDYFSHNDDCEDTFDVKKEENGEKHEKETDFDEILNQIELLIDSKETEEFQLHHHHSIKTSRKISERKIRYNNARKSMRKQYVYEDDIPLNQLKKETLQNDGGKEDILDLLEQYIDMQEQTQVKSQSDNNTKATAIANYRYLNRQRKKAIILNHHRRANTGNGTSTTAQTYRSKRTLAWKRDYIAIRDAAKAQRSTPKQCQLCKKMFANSSSLSAHMLRHAKHKFICEHCGKSTTTNSELQSHLVFRHGSGRFLQCHLCDFKAFRKYDMSEHARTHTGERPFACDKCGLTFTRHSVWRRHRRYHQDKRFQCPLCPRRFHFRADMKAHGNNVHARLYMYACGQCGVTYTKTCTVRRHLRDKHGVPRERQGKILRIKKGEPGVNLSQTSEN